MAVYTKLSENELKGFFSKYDLGKLLNYQEIKDGKSNEWVGTDVSYKLNSETLISLFYGSQKGGLVCANGICAEQPGFEDGYKLTFRSLF